MGRQNKFQNSGCCQWSGDAIPKKEGTHRMAEVNRVSAQFLLIHNQDPFKFQFVFPFLRNCTIWLFYYCELQRTI